MSVLKTERLVLREFTLEDAKFILELLNEPGFLRYIGDKGVRNLQDARNYLTQGPIDSYVHNGFGLYAVALLDGTLTGMCGLVSRPGLEDPDIGFAFLARHSGQGFAIEAARAVYEHGVNVLKLRRILAIVTPENARSIGVLQKLGLKFERFVRLNPDAELLKLYA